MLDCYGQDVRTTLTLDEDVAERLKSVMKRSGWSFKETVNELLRLGLEAQPPPRRRPAFRVEARDLKLRPGLDLSNIGELLEQLEGPGSR